MQVRRSLAGVLGAAALTCAPAAAHAATPPNDSPAWPGEFTAYTAENGVPSERQAIAELAEATPDGGIVPCLGPDSFARTVWYRIPEVPVAQELTIEAWGRTLDVIDLAAFVQPEVPPAMAPPGQPAPSPTPAPAARASQAYPAGTEPNACFGAGAGGSDAAEEPTSGLTLRVPANHPVYVQVGRRGTPSSPDDERAVLSLVADALDGYAPPRGDRGDATAPRARHQGNSYVGLWGATITGEDPAQPACPSLGSVWRKIVPPRDGKRLVSVYGRAASTLTVFRGKRPTADNVLDCVNRERHGPLQLNVDAHKRRPLWVRIGTDRPPDLSEAMLRVTNGRGTTVIDGGPGGFDPTTGGPGGGFPGACGRADARRARVAGPRLAGRAGARNALTRVPIRVVVKRSSICDVDVRLYGPKGRLYARGRAIRLAGRRTVRLARLRTFVRGRYRMRVTAASPFGDRIAVPAKVRGRLR